MKNVDKMTAREMRNEIRGLRKLLAEAICPRDCIDGAAHHFAGRLIPNGLREDWKACDWCAGRSELIGHDG